MRKWGINIFNSDEVKYTFLTRKLMTVLKGHVLFFMCLLSHHPFNFSCIWVLSMFSLRLLLLLIFSFSSTEEQTAEVETENPQPGPWQMSSGKDVPECKTQQTPLCRFSGGPTFHVRECLFMSLCVYPWQSCRNPTSVEFPLCHQDWKMKEWDAFP